MNNGETEARLPFLRDGFADAGELQRFDAQLPHASFTAITSQEAGG